MPANFPEPADRRSSLSTRPVSTGRTGLIIGAIVVALMLGAFAYFWSAAGRETPPPAPVDSAVQSPAR